MPLTSTQNFARAAHFHPLRDLQLLSGPQLAVLYQVRGKRAAGGSCRGIFDGSPGQPCRARRRGRPAEREAISHVPRGETQRARAGMFI